ncbi:MAG: M1 family aminopeptidase [Pirellulaceae bacterium]|nr:HEAT repeat domain-containing protein [Planctomycetales bacterium]
MNRRSHPVSTCCSSSPDNPRWMKALASRGADASLRVVLFLLAASLLVGTGRADELGGEQWEEAHVCRFHETSSYAAASSDDSDPLKYAPDREVDIVHIKLDVTPDFDKRTVEGTAAIQFRPIAKPLTQLRLDAVNLNIKKVRASAEVDDFSSTSDALTVVFRHPISADTDGWLEVDYSAEPRQGLYFRTPAMGYPSTDTHIWTQGEAHEARHWFPCYDYPNERSSTEVICHVPVAMTVLSNGEKISEEADSGTNLKAVRWRQDKPHVAYLICLVAGHFEKLEKRHRDIPLAYYVQPSLAPYAKNSFRDTDDIMAFFEQEIGVPFPWNKYYQVTIQDFTAGGMENTTLTTLTHNTLFDEATENIHSSRGLDAHEMAHQWFGDYVTCKDWSHLWLNEGFATYYAHLHEGHQFGPDALKYSLYQDAKRSVLTHGNDDKAIVYRKYGNAMEQFDYRAYPKGSWVLHMLRCRLGEDLYRRCVKTYLERHALTSVVTEDLNAVIEELSGESFDRFFDQWVYHPGHPDLKVSYDWNAATKLAKVTVQQTQSAEHAVPVFHFDTKLRFIVDGKAVDHLIEVRQRKQEFHVPLNGQPTIVRFDPEFTLLAHVDFNKSDAFWFAQLKQADDAMGRVFACEHLADRKTKASVEALEASLNDDPFYGVRIAAASSLGKIHTDDAFAALQAGLDDQDARVRREVADELGKFYRTETPDLLEKIVTREANPAIRAVALRALGRFHGPRTNQLLVANLEDQSFRHELANAAIDAMEKLDDPLFVPHLMKHLQEHTDRLSARDLGQALQTLAQLQRDADDKNQVREFLQSKLTDSRRQIRAAAARALGSLGDPRAIAALEIVTDTEPHDSTANAAKSAVDRLRQEKKVVPDEVVELRKSVAELQKDKDSLRKDIDELKSQLEAIQSSVKPATDEKQ